MVATAGPYSMGLTSPSAPSTSRRLDVQGLRAFAVAAVVADHAHLGLHGGFVGVDVFFAISGFVIGRLLIKDLTDHGRIRLKRFYGRRVLRLLPAMALVTVVTALAGAFLLSPLGIQADAAVTGAAATLWSSNIVLAIIANDYFSDGVQENPYLHTWSLGVEEQFYLAFPLLLMACWVLSRRNLDPIRFIAPLGVVAALSFALSAYLSFGGRVPGVSAPEIFAFYMMPTRMWEFLAGFFLAALLNRPRPLSGAASASFTVLGTLVLIGSTLLIEPTDRFPGIVAVFPVLGAVLVIWGGATDNSASKMWAHPLLVHLGNISYSLYLWHWPVLVFSRRLGDESLWSNVMAVVVSWLLAELTYRLIENRFRVAGTPRVRELAAPAVGVLLSLTACSVLFAGARTLWGDPELKDAVARAQEAPVDGRRCIGAAPLADRDMSECTFGKNRSGAPVYLVGDSNAHHYVDGLEAAAQKADRPLIVLTRQSCPFVTIQHENTLEAGRPRQCNAFASDGLKWLAQREPGLVLMGSSSELVTYPEVSFVKGSRRVTSTEEKATLWESALEESFAAVRRAGHEPMLLETPPHFPGDGRRWWNPVSCSTSELVQGPDACGTERRWSEQVDDMRAVYDAERQSTSRTKTGYVQVHGTLCPGGICSTGDGDSYYYRDGLHLTPAGSRSLTPIFDEVLADN